MYISYLRQKTCLFWVSQCRKQETGGPGKWFFAQMSRRCFAQILHRKLVNLMEANEITYLIRGAAFRVHTALGPGLLESVYEAALKYELQRDGLRVRNQVGIPMIYGEIKFDLGFRLDLLVEEQVIVEIKSVEILNDVHFKQLMTYLRLSNKQLNSDYS